VKRDLEHLKLLTIFHFVLAALTALGHSFFLIHLVMGIMMVTGAFPGPKPGTPGGPPAFVGWLFTGLGGFMVLWGWSLAIGLAIAGFCLSRRKGRMFCCIVAGFSCLHMPLGTALGVCTLLVLLRPSVKDLFDGKIVEPRDPEDQEDDDEPPRRRPARRARVEDREEAQNRPDDDRFTLEK
jgi:hypothetical protein